MSADAPLMIPFIAEKSRDRPEEYLLAVRDVVADLLAEEVGLKGGRIFRFAVGHRLWRRVRIGVATDLNAALSSLHFVIRVERRNHLIVGVHADQGVNRVIVAFEAIPEQGIG